MSRTPLGTRAFGEALLKAFRSFNGGKLKLTRSDRETLAKVESPVLNVPRRSLVSDPYPISHQLNVYDGNRPTFKAPPL